MLRHTVADILAGCKFSSIFSAVDMAENLDAKQGQVITTCGYFGLLGAEFDVVGDYYERKFCYTINKEKEFYIIHQIKR